MKAGQLLGMPLTSPYLVEMLIQYLEIPNCGAEKLLSQDGVSALGRRARAFALNADLQHSLDHTIPLGLKTGLPAHRRVRLWALAFNAVG